MSVVSLFRCSQSARCFDDQRNEEKQKERKWNKIWEHFSSTWATEPASNYYYDFTILSTFLSEHRITQQYFPFQFDSFSIFVQQSKVKRIQHSLIAHRMLRARSQLLLLFAALLLSLLCIWYSECAIHACMDVLLWWRACAAHRANAEKKNK